jgi:5-methylcytosine-specific restriction endonuclease McrA
VRFAPAIGLDVDGVPLKRCIQCATVFRQNRTSNVCSDECRVRTRQDKRRRKESRRRANGGDPYSLTDVVRKSDGHCHLCSLPVNLTLPGSHPDGATVDHLIPVSLGGADDIANVALAHRRCNVLRGVKPLEAADVAR